MGGLPNFDHVAYTRVDNNANKMVMPREIYDKGVLTHPDDLESDDDTAVGKAHWSYDISIGWVVLSDQPLDGDITVQETDLFEDGIERVKYKTPTGREKSYTQQDESASWTLTIPKPFLSTADSDGRGLQSVPDGVGFRHGERLHLVTAEEFLSDEPNEVKSCFVLTNDQFNTILRSEVPEEIPQGWTPRFM